VVNGIKREEKEVLGEIRGGEARGGGGGGGGGVLWEGIHTFN
jgi:hypothetical protein